MYRSLQTLNEDNPLVTEAVLVSSDKKLLLVKRSDTAERLPGQWDLPGAHVDKGEDLNAAANREVYEETGIKISSSELQLSYVKSMQRVI